MGGPCDPWIPYPSTKGTIAFLLRSTYQYFLPRMGTNVPRGAPSGHLESLRTVLEQHRVIGKRCGCVGAVEFNFWNRGSFVECMSKLLSDVLECFADYLVVENQAAPCFLRGELGSPPRLRFKQNVCWKPPMSRSGSNLLYDQA